MQEDIFKHLGPLANLVGIWEGEKGVDVAPDKKRGTETNKYSERITFVPFGPVNNHEQTLYGLRYSTVATRIGADAPFHEELGYWLWDAEAHQVLRCFMVPRGVTVLAGGTAKPDQKEFQLSAEVGSHTYGICSNPFLDKEFKTMKYNLTITVHGEGVFSYQEDTILKMPGRKDMFHHTDQNRLKRISFG